MRKLGKQSWGMSWRVFVAEKYFIVNARNSIVAETALREEALLLSATPELVNAARATLAWLEHKEGTAEDSSCAQGIECVRLLRMAIDKVEDDEAIVPVKRSWTL